MRGIFSHLSEDQVGAALVRGRHAPDQEDALAEEIAGEEVQQRVGDSLHHREDGEHHPVAHPGQARLPVVAHDGVQALVSGVQEPHPHPNHRRLAARHGHRDYQHRCGKRGLLDKRKCQECESPSVPSAATRAKSSLAPAPASTGQCQAAGSGESKGWPLNLTEMPKHIQRFFDFFGTNCVHWPATRTWCNIETALTITAAHQSWNGEVKDDISLCFWDLNGSSRLHSWSV